MKKLKIKNIKKINYSGKIYTPEIKDNHNYFLGESCILSKNCQNDTILGLKTLLTRVGEDCRVFATGSIKQIDNPYLNSKNNALTYLINKVKEPNEYNKIAGIELHKTVRSKLAEWVESWE